MEPSNTYHDDDSYESEKAKRIREQKTLDKFLAGSGCCIFCHTFDPLVLEEHHIAGRKHSGITLTVCANHHAILSKMQGSWPKDWLRKGQPAYKRVAFFLRGASDIFRLMSDELLRTGDECIDSRGRQ